MLYNISNHPSSTWGDVQLRLAKEVWGGVKDIPFPPIDPYANEEEISELVEEFLDTNFPDDEVWEETGNVFLVQGEFTFTYALVRALQSLGCTCVVATSGRNTVDNPDGSKTVKFKFCKFRKYPE